MTTEPNEYAAKIRPVRKRKLSRENWVLAGIFLTLVAGAVAYRLLVFGELEQTAAMFIGLPALLGLILSLTGPANTGIGRILKGITIALLMSGTVLGEGFICVVMAAPLFYLVGIAVHFLLKYVRSKNNRINSHALLALVPVLLFSLEGLHPALSFDREETVTVERVVELAPEEFAASLARAPRFEEELPLFLSIGFPSPLGATGHGLRPGDRRTIAFTAPNGTADMVVEVERVEANFVRFVLVADQTKIAHWLNWSASEIRWEPAEAGRTRVFYKASFQRLLDPAFYFAPLERYAMALAAGYLIDNIAASQSSGE